MVIGAVVIVRNMKVILHVNVTAVIMLVKYVWKKYVFMKNRVRMVMNVVIAVIRVVVKKKDAVAEKPVDRVKFAFEKTVKMIMTVNRLMTNVVAKKIVVPVILIVHLANAKELVPGGNVAVGNWKMMRVDVSTAILKVK